MIEEIIQKQSIFVKKFEGDLSILDKHINHILEFDKGRKVSNEGGYQSNDITFGFDDLLTSIKKGFDYLNQTVSLDNFWLNINKGSNFNHPHLHGISGWSVVYYHKVCCDQSPIVFPSLVPCIQNTETYFTPKSQQIIFFKAWYPHYVKACNQLNHERISLAFNFK